MLLGMNWKTIVLWNRKLTQITSVEMDLDVGNRKLGKERVTQRCDKTFFIMGSEEAQPEAGAEKTRLELNHDCNSKVGLVILLLIVEQPDNKNYQ